MAEIIEGMGRLQSQFRSMEISLQKKGLMEIAKAGGEVLAEEEVRRAPRDTGAMAGKIRVRPLLRESDIMEASVAVGPDKKHFYWYFQEKGTRHHAPQPFMEPAFVSSRPRIITAMRAKMAEILKDAIG